MAFDKILRKISLHFHVFVQLPGVQGGRRVNQSMSAFFVCLFHSVPWIGSWRQLEIRLLNEALNKVMINCQTLSNDILHPQVTGLA